MRQVSIKSVSSPLKKAFSISRGAKTSAETVQVIVEADGKTGRGECVPYARYDESPESVVAQIKSVKTRIENDRETEDLQQFLPPGAARCAVDTALWDLRAKQKGRPVWDIAGLPQPRPLKTAITISLDTPEAMAQAASDAKGKILKLKLDGKEDLDRLNAVHEARPDAQLVLDGNEGMDPRSFATLLDHSEKLGVVLIEQPFPAGEDDILLGRPGGVAICADESVHTRRDLQKLARKYDVVNIKLDKAGGFTEALAMVEEARQCGLGVMIGCMVAGSLSMAPAFLLGMKADLIDLDGPIWLEEDIEHGMTFTDGMVSPPSRDLWG